MKQRLHRFIRPGVAAIFILVIFVAGGSVARAFSNIDSTDKWAWNDVVGWIDFYASNSGLNVKSTKIDRWGEIYDSTNSYIATHCTSLPPDANNDCTPTFGVVNNASGTLSGFAWSDDYGWISFASSSPAYGVTIDGSGNFQGWAWNDIIGWISFCGGLQDPDCPGTVSYKVNTTWELGGGDPPPDNYLESSTIDTGSDDGLIINSIYWEGTKASGSTIGFQLAVSTSTDFTGVEFLGEDGTSSTIYEVLDTDDDGIESVKVNSVYHNPLQSGYRYFRYRVYLDKSAGSPIVSKVIVNWSRG